MAILKNNEYKTVVWGSKNNFITGLDPLGLQITSEATYATLLPGVTNLTNRIRYYGFYCWLLDFYAENIRDTNQQTQNNFIRKAELLMALLVKTQNPNFTQVTGSQFAVNNSDFLTPFQEKQMSTQPDFILEYAHYLVAHFKSQGHQNIAVHVESYVALNGRLSQPFINPEVNLLDLEDTFTHKDWILEFNDTIQGI